MEELSKPVICSIEESVGIITLNRPHSYNAANHDLTTGLLDGLAEFNHDNHVKVIVIHGAGPGFCAGADMKDFGSKDVSQAGEYIVNYYGEIVNRIINSPKLVLGAIHGSAAGVGTAIALACDFRVMEEGANLRFAFINIGLGPDGGAGWLLARAVGYSKALEIAVEGNKIEASTCYQLGLCNKLVPSGQAIGQTKQWAQALALRPPIGVAITKQALHHAYDHSLKETIILEANNQVKALQSRDHQEGVMAFLQKRQPKFLGE